MELELTEEQEALAEMVRDLFGAEADAESLARVADSDRGYRPELWAALGEAGILGLTIAEEYGGAGAGPVEVAVVLTEVGRLLAPEPVLDAVYLPAELLSHAGSSAQKERYLPGLANGAHTGAVAHAEPGDRWPYRAVATTARPTGDGYALTGTKALVAHGDEADFFVVTARVGADVGLFVVDGTASGIDRSEYRGPDRRRGAHLQFSDVHAERLDHPDVGALLDRIDVYAQTALAAEAVGAMDESLRVTVGYLKTRKQFGVPLSSFQALTHRAADLYVLIELARSVSRYAVGLLEAGIVDPSVASHATLQVSRSSRVVGRETVHLHGGIGVTDEYVIGHYAARMLAIEAVLGGVDAHLGVLAKHVDAHDCLTIGVASQAPAFAAAFS